MNRDQFVEMAAKMDLDELQRIAEESRVRANNRIPQEVQKVFRSLDDITSAQELYVTTDFGKTHVFLVRKAEEVDEHLPVIINVHGGGWCLDHTERDIYFSRRLAVRTGCLVVDVDYVLAPEYPYPAALEEIEALLNRLPEMLSSWGGDPHKVIFCGQSAGGNLLGAVSQRKRFTHDITVLKQILCYFPADNYSNRFGDEELDARDESTEYYGFFYNPVFGDRKKADVSLVFAETDDLKGLPPTDIITAGLDNLMPEAEKYAAMVQKAGIPCTLQCFEHSRHGFLVNLYDEWKEGEDYIVSLIEKVL